MNTSVPASLNPRSTAHLKWAPKREEAIAALKAGWSVHAVVRALEVPEATVVKWKIAERIPAYTGPKRPMPEVGQKLT